VEFAVTTRTDAEVAIVNGKGEVVRHLAAGMLSGEAPPPAPLKAGLTQSVPWDGKDDYGQPVAGAGVRVRIGMGARLETIVGGDPYAFWSPESGQGDHTQWRVTGLEAKSDGSVYISVGNPLRLPALRKYDARGTIAARSFPTGRQAARRCAGLGRQRADGWQLLAQAQLRLERPNSGLDADVRRHRLRQHLVRTADPSPDKDTLCVAQPFGFGNQQMTVRADGTLRQFAR